MSRLSKSIVIMSILLPVFSASAVTVPLAHSGWEVDIPDNMIGGVTVDYVNKSFEDVNDWYAEIKIGKTFTEAPISGIIPPITMVFNQIAPDDETVRNIRILEEGIVNQTGATWTDYHWSVNTGFLVAFDSDNAVFTGDPEDTPDDAFGVYPFSEYEWQKMGIDYMRLSVWDGLVPDGQAFSPGQASDGYLEIRPYGIDFTDSFSFTFMQGPTIPEQATGASLIAMFAVLLRRRRQTRLQ